MGRHIAQALAASLAASRIRHTGDPRTTGRPDATRPRRPIGRLCAGSAPLRLASALAGAARAKGLISFG